MSLEVQDITIVPEDGEWGIYFNGRDAYYGEAETLTDAMEKATLLAEAHDLKTITVQVAEDA